MATEKIERKYSGVQGDELFKNVENTLDPYVKKYALQENVDAGHKHISIKKTGVSGEVQVEGDKVSLQLDYSPLMPGPLRSQITKEVTSALDHLNAKGGG